MKENNKGNYLLKYYDNNAANLHKMVDRILRKYNSVCQYVGLYNKDKDDFYSLANEVFVDVLNKYDGEQSFDAFLYICLSNKIKSYITARNRVKRTAEKNAISMDMLVYDSDNITVSDMIADRNSADPEKYLTEEILIKNLLQHFKFRKERLIVMYIIDGYSNDEISHKLNMSRKNVVGVVQSIRDRLGAIDIL